MPDTRSLKEAVEDRGAFAVWDLLTEDEQRSAATVTWENAEGEARQALQGVLAKELKFRMQSVRRLSAEMVAGRLTHLAKDLPEPVLFQFLFHLHMVQRRNLLVEFLDGVGLPHEDGVLDLPEDADNPDPKTVATAASALLEGHDHQALIYLATLKVADGTFWAGLDGVLDGYDESGTAIAKPKKPEKKTVQTGKKATTAKATKATKTTKKAAGTKKATATTKAKAAKKATGTEKPTEKKTTRGTKKTK
ncbi:MAG: hypothetical protein LJE95_12120 [Acidobacteria bacterium]|nr:hypothetical protein [Acidobacteriota bacterium]